MNKYLDPRSYIRVVSRRITKEINHTLLRAIEPLLLREYFGELRHPPVFFLGAPRSGSTLIIQTLTDALNLGYISNAHCKWYGAPALVEKLVHPTRNKLVSDYKSNFGATNGDYGPAECGDWWYRFFRKYPQYVSLDEVDKDKMERFRRSVVALVNVCDKPVVFKNMYAALRIQPIASEIPESLFVVTHRDEVDNGHSLLEARFKIHSDYRTWWSMRPSSYDELEDLMPEQQVIEQIRHIHMDIERDLKYMNVSSDRRFDIEYESFCRDPRHVVASFQQFLADNGSTVSSRHPIPVSFSPRREVRIDLELYRRMRDYVTHS